mgnify:FL=1
MLICSFADQCEAHNRFYSLAPELFDVDDLGIFRALNDAHVPVRLKNRAVLAIAKCPEFAITLVEG